jgi:hypothetical protein
MDNLEGYAPEHLTGEIDLTLRGIAKSVVSELSDVINRLYEFPISMQTSIAATYNSITQYIHDYPQWQQTQAEKKIIRHHRNLERQIICEEVKKDGVPLPLAYLLSKGAVSKNENIKRGLEVALSQTVVYHARAFAYLPAKHFKLNELRMYRDGVIGEISYGFPLSVMSYFMGFKHGDLISTIVNKYTPFHIGAFDVPEKYVVPLTIGCATLFAADTMRKIVNLKKRKPVRGLNNYINPTAWPNTFILISFELIAKKKQLQKIMADAYDTVNDRFNKPENQHIL